MKPKHALIGVNPHNFQICFFSGWTLKGLLAAADDGLMMFRTSWEKMEEISLYSMITDSEFMELSECENVITEPDFMEPSERPKFATANGFWG